MAEDYYYVNVPRRESHGLLVAVVVGLLVAGPLFLGGDGDSVGAGVFTDAVAELLGPVGLLLLPAGLIILIRVLSSERGPVAVLADVFAFGGGSQDGAVGSPVWVALALLLILLMLHYRSLLFGDDGGDDE